MNERIPLLNILVDNFSLQELLQTFDKGFLVTPNTDVLMQLQTNREFFNAYGEADYVVMDSQIAYWATKFLGHGLKEKISGSDFFPKYCEYHRNNSLVRIFLLGGKTGVAKKATQRINAKIGREIIVGAHSPSMQFIENHEECIETIDIINRSKANVLVVGLGSPKQELWIVRYRKFLNNVDTYMSVGATLDFEAGTLSRAPRWMSSCGLEWLYRLMQEPRRLWKRYLVRDMGFFVLVLKQKFGLYKSPFLDMNAESGARK